MLESRFGSIISRSSTDVGRMKLHTLDVQVTEGSPVFMKQYTIPLKYQNFIDNETKRLEEAGLISRSLSNWSAPSMVVSKKQDPDNPCEVQLRIVIDYRQLNKRIITSRAPDRNGKIGKVISNYPIPTIEPLLARLEGCKYFSILDLRSGYHHIGLSEQSKPLTLPLLTCLAPLKSLITLYINICKITYFSSTQYAYVYDSIFLCKLCYKDKLGQTYINMHIEWKEKM